MGHSFLLQIQYHLQFLILNDLFKIQFHPEPFQPGDRYPEVSEHGAYLWFALLSHARETNLACTIHRELYALLQRSRHNNYN